MITFDIKKIVKLIVNILTYILLAILVLMIYGKAVMTFGNSLYPNFFGYTILQIESGSMEPTIGTSDIILVKLGNENIKGDDIISYISNNAIITHRVVYTDGEKYTCKGDANNTIDSTITKSMIIGKVVKIYPKLGVWKKVFSEPKIMLVLFVTLVLFDMALSKNMPQKKKEKKEEPIDLEKAEIKEVVIKPKTPKKVVKQEEEPVITKVELPDEKKEKIDSKKLLEFTNCIDISEINKLLKESEKKSAKKTTTKKTTTKKASTPRKTKVKKEIVEEEINENETLDYTIRLDLSEIQKKINEKVK